MNLSDWIKAAALITQQKQEAVTADTDQLSSMPLSQLAMDESQQPTNHALWNARPCSNKYTNTYRDGYIYLTAGRYLSANNTRYTSGFIIPYFSLT